MRVDYHFHTERSYDSRSSLEAVLDAAIRARIDVLCVTDHDTIESALELQRIAPPKIKVIVGCEFTCDDGSHIIGLHLRDMIAERRALPLMEAIQLQGGRVLLPHPFRRGSGIFRPELRRSQAFIDEVLACTDIVECFNGRDTYENNRLNHRFALDRGLASVASSDAHEAHDIGSVFVEYLDHGFEHGTSPRRIFFPTQIPRREHPLKRAMLELYHRNERRLPPVLGRAYRMARAQFHRDAPRWAEPNPRAQYELSFTRGPLP